MPTQSQYNVTLQTVRDIDCKIAVLDFDYTLLDEITGITTNIQMSVDADSDVRRTADIAIELKNDSMIDKVQSFYWTAGNEYWFDKYVQIYTAIKDVRTDEYVWVNHGIYCINSPSISYDAISNSLSFQAVDLMSKLTGMRNGQLEGMTYTVPAGSNIKGAVEGMLIEQGFTKYILYDPPQDTTPEDINIDAGSNAWDLLRQLRDINANWEMFFDIDGVFHFQQIPSGKVLLTETYNPVTDVYGEPYPLVTHELWDKLDAGYAYDTNFEDVKNCVVVLGKVHNPNEFAACVVAGAAAYVTLSSELSTYLNNTWTIEFGIQSDDTGAPVQLGTPITRIYIYAPLASGATYYVTSLSVVNTPLTVGNEEYCLEMTVGNTLSDITLQYLGYMQPRATAIENNPDSPFYIGESTAYTCKTGNAVDFIDKRKMVVAEVNGVVTSSLLTVDVRPWLSASDFNAASVGTEWLFKVNVKLNAQNTPIVGAVVRGGGKTVSGLIKNMQDETISLDYSQSYVLVVSRGTGTDPVFGMMYYPIPASQIGMSTTDETNLPKFNNQVRYVCCGDEYDNIYTNDLAEQRARYEIYLRARLHDTITITSVPIYWLDVNQIIEYNLPNNTSGESDLWLVKSIVTNFDVDGVQTITATKYYPMYADISLVNMATQT